MLGTAQPQSFDLTTIRVAANYLIQNATQGWTLSNFFRKRLLLPTGFGYAENDIIKPAAVYRNIQLKYLIASNSISLLV